MDPPSVELDRPSKQGILNKIITATSTQLEKDGWDKNIGPKLWRATVVSLTDDGRRLLAVGLKSKEIGNDRHVYSEFLLDGRSFKILRHKSFYFDIAGLEGVEFGVLFIIALAVFGAFTALMVALYWLGMSLKRMRL